MRCIFCTSNSDASRSREHILPEALGNQEHILPPGVVCDACNSYFAVKVEGPILDTLHFTNLRARQAVLNKRRRLPTMRGFYPAARIPIGLQRIDEGLSIGPLRETDNDQFVRTIQAQKTGRIWIPIGGYVEERLLARFLAKVAVEMFADRYLTSGEPASSLLDIVQLEDIRRFARCGDRPPAWPIHRRRIYPEDTVFDVDGEQVMHEFDFLHTADGELFAVICVFGEEFAINVGGPSVDGYLAFLNAEGGRSPLYGPGELEAVVKPSSPRVPR